MKTAISIPDAIFKQAEEIAKDLKMSRSELYTTALKEYLNEKQALHTTDLLNQVYDTEASALDPALVEMQASSLPTEEW